MPRLAAELTAAAKQEKAPKSVVIRKALEAALRTKKGELKLTAHDVMKAGCGIVKGGPRDRSWNPKRLKGYGRD